VIIIPYLRDGRVHASFEAYEGGDGIASYEVVMDLEGNMEITTEIDGKRYRSLWCWEIDSKKPYGAVPMIQV
jgi:hypothetical protein